MNYPSPTEAHPVSSWTWYVAAGCDRKQRQERLAACPEDKRDEVRVRVERLFEEAAKIRSRT
jgi:hypothetical protein